MYMESKKRNIFIISAIAGLIGGALATKAIYDRNENKPANILKRIQLELSSLGEIGDSWISGVSEEFEGKKVYNGLVQVTEGNKKYQLEFKADVINGEVVQMQRLKGAKTTKTTKA